MLKVQCQGECELASYHLAEIGSSVKLAAFMSLRLHKFTHLPLPSSNILLLLLLPTTSHTPSTLYRDTEARLTDSYFPCPLN